MKIVEISFKNINNLKGETVISFDSLPLSSAGIFAITGPTGSGKSTILDVITLALFNRIPRFKKAITKSEIEGLGSVITHHTDEAEANILYEIRGKQYRSTWSVKKARTGNLKDYEMFLYDASGTPIDLKKSEVPAKNEEIIGLKYDQFIKSIILSQGQFSKFLKADKNERGQLLENLTGSHIYRKLGAAAYDRHKSVKSEVSLALELLKNIQSLSIEERADLRSQIADANTNRLTLDQELSVLIKLRTIKQNTKAYQDVLMQKLAEKQILDVDVQNFADKQRKLQQHEKLNPLRADLTKYQLSTNRAKELRNNIAVHERSVAASKTEHQAAIEEMSNLTRQIITSETFMTAMSAFEKKVNALDQQLLYIQKRGVEMRTQINQKITDYRIDLDPKSNPGAAILYLSDRKAAIGDLLMQAGMDVTEDPATSRKRLAAMGEEIYSLTQLSHSYEHLADSKSQAEKLNAQLKVALDTIDKVGPVATKTEALVKVLEDTISALLQRIEDQKIIASLSDHRGALSEGDPCPLCGSLEHPYADHQPVTESNLQAQVREKRQQMQTQKKDLERYNSDLVSAKTTIDLTQKRLTILDEDRSKLEESIAILLQQIDSKGDATFDKIQATIRSLVTAKEVWAKAIDAADQYRGIDALLGQFTDMQLVLAEHSDTKKLRMEIYAGRDASEDCNRIQNKFARSANALASQSAILSKENEELKHIDAELVHLSSVLHDAVLTLGFAGISGAMTYLVSEVEITQIKRQQEELTRRSTTLTAEIGTLHASIKNYLKEDTAPEQTLELLLPQIEKREMERDAHISTVGEKTAVLGKDDQERKRIEEKQKQIDELEIKLRKWDLLNRMIGNADGSKFANFAQGLTLQNLLSFANRRLANLTDRYLLDKPQKDGALTVIDQYQGNIQRSVTTLSGGESFLISLALALSLSDMASRNVRLESLFIDEGFGTLDQETLDIAMSTLERLQTESQKTVGVISHVETLKDRIHVQIQLEKDAMGYSKVRVVG